MIENRSVKRLVEDELDWEPSLDAARIGVAVEEGIVTLSGHVGSYVQKLTADRVVRRLRAVRGFVDRLEVQPERMGCDEDIARRAANLIAWGVAVPANSVKVQVAEGAVILTGEVAWDYQRRAAEQGIQALAGVVAVTNRITVKPNVTATDIKRSIEDALARRAGLEDAQILVSVEDGKVRLEGTVRALSERDIAERTAWEAPGVRDVDDPVTVGG